MAKGLATLFTLIRLLPRVDPLVDDEGRAPDEGFPTLLALIGLLPRVDPPVLAEAGTLSKGLATFVTVVPTPLPSLEAALEVASL